MHKTTLIGAVLAAALFSVGSLACDAMGPGVHMGQLMSVDPANNRFTIRDAQSGGPITFSADADILKALKTHSGSVRVDYEENDEGNKAVDVSF
ncbi:MAG: hypothetical protein L3J88_09830 [Gammaproteobacteria bacterium]|nr:hypothetical protein [Gammaproteobacteria bacterium]MCF6363620.1 hypothetical protein [Gammaproteobacteria bacterium]